MPKRSSKPRERSPPRGRSRRPRSGRSPFRSGPEPPPRISAPSGLNATGATKGPGISRQALSRPANERTRISAEMAVPLSKTFGSSPETWLRMPTAYDLRQARERADRITVERFAA